MQKNCFLVLILAGVVFIPGIILASLGVGVGTGKIEFDQPLKMGGIYISPPLNVINTGDEAADYGVSIEYKQDQPRISPPKDWFSFEPEFFHLDPGQSQVVQVKISIPVKSHPGEYFAYLEGHPVRKIDTSGGASIGIGAAAKLYFEISPANIFQGFYYRAVSVIKNNAPWSYIILLVLVASILINIFKKYFSFNIGITRKKVEKIETE
ncbi:MAG: hypothetical protein UR69_C0003G0063 [Candidatus Moranbacteria bacterium GW2011_GWE2_35_2-]|nr:MAG: hypothetical protein UR69_C0003G0063 [Candidatus Moranbacteria bacterium GW2011_GWE2_35_2-]KKQ05485.1 MAG: hypothetical protein US15_C0029G0002 [Candidatus Moranbacteria bacterium GW2011_GWF1_36_4]KKQ22081.1 MAG: hypothetical protein US37_C0004G0040 [Candidatus Moranbacteria bacterium GW2011_GWF2_37_11]KKQ29166.1 MAG: hypothetical protein US44_C0003G0078 [Candidatus Moranbacteria bacterium GW2011_GWD1_37_17]KKQ31151.1 MAG: hypothetical protein US47_C0001G0384 [Candidatus Moranbacteria b